MKRIVREILEAEERVDAALRQAREEAAETVRSVETEITAKIGDTREEARKIIQTAVEDAEREAKRIRQETLKQADQQQEALLHGHAEIMDDLAGRICNIVLTTEADLP